MTSNKFLVCASLPVFLSGACLADFSGPYAPDKWTFIAGPGGTLLTHIADVLVLEGGGDVMSGNTDILITAAASGAWSFDWSYVSGDLTARWDAAYYLINDEAVFLAIADLSDPPITGSISVLVQAGDTIGFRVHTVDGLYGEGELTITNFQAPVPTPAILAVLGLGLMPARRRRTAP